MKLHREYGTGLRHIADRMSGGQFGYRTSHRPNPDADPSMNGNNFN
jgi:hypothetical protein